MSEQASGQQMSAHTPKLVILDRDGVINEKLEGYVRTPEEWTPIDGSIEAMVELHRNDYQLVVASNQAGIGRGIMTIDDLIAVHAKMQSLLGAHRVQVDGLFFCPHAPTEKCECRKPKPGLLNDIARRYHLSLENTFFIGDSIRDVQAATAAGAKPMMVRTGLGATEAKQAPAGVPIHDNLAAAAAAILNPATKQ